MAVTLVGEVVNQCDNTTGFNAGSADSDIFVEPTASIGAKVSGTTASFFTTSLGTTAPYDFSSTGNESGYHIIMWFNSLTPVSTTNGFRIIVGNGTNQGEWYVPPDSSYTGGFLSRVVDTASDFNNLPAGSWSLTGNPGQLTNITQMGGTITTTTSIMGNFNNALIDQITIGTGVRVNGGTSGSPNTFETVRVADEGANKWGWWTSSAGSYIGKGKIYLGPATGTTTSVFSDFGQTIVYSDSSVAVGFYEINIRGTNTDVDLEGCVIRSENVNNSRWSLTLDSTSIPTFNDNGSLFQGFEEILLQNGSQLLDTKLDNGNSVIQNSATLDGCRILNANTTSGSALISSNNPTNIKNCTFTFSAGHAIEITSTGTYSFSGNTFTGYGADGSNDAAIYNNSGGAVTLNILDGGDTPTIRNGSGATTTVNNTVVLRITVRNSFGAGIFGARVYLEADVGGDMVAGTVIFNTLTDIAGIVEDTGFNFTSNQPVIGRVRKGSTSPYYKTSDISGTITSGGFFVNIIMVEDE